MTPEKLRELAETNREKWSSRAFETWYVHAFIWPLTDLWRAAVEGEDLKPALDLLARYERT